MKRYIVAVGLVCSLGFSFLMGHTFLWALLNGGETTIHINRYGEMWWEAVLVALILVINTISVFVAIKKVAK